MPNRLTDHSLVQDANITVSRWSRFFGDTISEWIESAVQEWKDDTKRNGRFKTSFWGCFDPIDLCKFSCSARISDFRVRMQIGKEEKSERHQGETNRSLGLLTTFFPCVTCGKTFHRLHYQGDMSEYEIVNAPVSFPFPTLRYAKFHRLLLSSFYGTAY